MRCEESKTSAHRSHQRHQRFVDMNAFQALLCLALAAASCAATIETPVSSRKAAKTDQDSDVQAAVVLLSKTIEDWLNANPDRDPSIALTQLAQLIDETDVMTALAEEDDETQEPESDAAEYGLGKKFKKWRKKLAKIASNAAKAAAINKAVGAAASAMG